METLFGQVVLDLLFAVIVGVGFWVIKHAVTYLKDKIKREYADRAVQFVEQVCIDVKGTDKYNEAVKWFVERMSTYRIKVTEEEIKGLIESALFRLKNEYNKQW